MGLVREPGDVTHLDEQPGTDVLVTREGMREGTRLFEGEFLESRSTHGTGCTFSAAIAAQLAHGRPLEEAIAIAKAYLTEAIRRGPDVGSGSGPTDHFFYLRDASPDQWLERLAVGRDKASHVESTNGARA